MFPRDLRPSTAVNRLAGTHPQLKLEGFVETKLYCLAAAIVHSTREYFSFSNVHILPRIAQFLELLVLSRTAHYSEKASLEVAPTTFV